MDNNEILKALAGVLVAGASGLVTSVASKKNLRADVDSIWEELRRLTGIVGAEQPHMSGFFSRIVSLEQTVGAIKKELQHFEENPPSWVARMARTRTSSFSLETEERFTELASQLAKLSSRLKRVEEAMSGNEGRYLTEKEFESYSKNKAEELAKFQSELANLNGTLRGILAGLNASQGGQR
jgi:chromosome segregation ATPase